MRETVTRVLLALALAALPACATGSSGVSAVSSGAGGGGGSGSGTGGRDGGADGDAGHDAGHDGGQPMRDAGPPPPTGDSLPPSAVSFFQNPTCPTGWVPYTMADGRLLLPTIATYPGGLTHGTPLTSGEDCTHTHGFAASFSIGSTDYVGAAGGGNGGVGPSGTLMLTGTTDPSSTGLPYIQLLVCRKNAPAVPGSAPLPSGLQMFFDMTACPIGWKQTTATQGRFIVGLPQGAPQDVTFGGPAISSVDGGADVRTHNHGNTVTLDTTSHGIALASGCCANGYAANGTYSSMQATDDGDTGLPYIELLQCQKE